MLKRLRMWLHPDTAAPQLRCASRTLRLPAGTIVAEQGLLHLRGAPGGHAVVALLDEAYVVVRLGQGHCWYATWQPYLGSWELLHLEEENQPGPAHAATAPHGNAALAH
jgi:hypothetical protein